jgi:hypothetical protein
MLVLGGVQGDWRCAARRFALLVDLLGVVSLFNGKP